MRVKRTTPIINIDNQTRVLYNEYFNRIIALLQWYGTSEEEIDFSKLTDKNVEDKPLVLVFNEFEEPFIQSVGRIAHEEYNDVIVLDDVEEEERIILDKKTIQLDNAIKIYNYLMDLFEINEDYFIPE